MGHENRRGLLQNSEVGERGSHLIIETWQYDHINVNEIIKALSSNARLNLAV